MENIEIHDLAGAIVDEVVYYNNNWWMFQKNKGWVNKTKDTNSSTFKYAIRNIIRDYLAHSTNSYNLVDASTSIIDNITKEVKTIIEGEKYTYIDIKKGFYFINGRLYIENNEWKFDKDYRGFTPTTMQHTFSWEKFNNRDDIYQNSIFKKFAENIAGDKIDLFMEHLGFHLSGEHSGVSLIIEGKTTIGKTTIGELIDYTLTGERTGSSIAKIEAKDFMTNKGDTFYLSETPNKPTWIVGEGASFMTAEKIKVYNDLIDESSGTYNPRMMRIGSPTMHKMFNLIITTNGAFDIQAGDAATLNAFKNRTSTIMSKAEGAILTLNEWKKLFTRDETEALIFKALEGFKRVKDKNTTRRKMFSAGDDEEFFKETEESNAVPDIIAMGEKIDDKGNKDEDCKVITEQWNNKTLDRITNNEIQRLINHYKKCGYTLSQSYKVSTFKKEFEKIMHTFGVEEVKRNHVFRVENKSEKGLKIYWKKGGE